jgi:hypothetical protein
LAQSRPDRSFGHILGVRVAAAIAATRGAGDLLRINPIKLAFASATSKPTLNLSLDRLAARRLISLKRRGPGGSIEMRILGERSRATLRH